MKKLIIVTGTTAAVALGLFLWGCGGQKTEQKPASTAQPQPAPQTAQTPSQAQAYPINWCLVSGEELGSMGAPIEYNYNGRQIKFCCKSCIKPFEKEPAKYLAKLDSAAAGLIKGPGAEEHEKGSGG